MKPEMSSVPTLVLGLSLVTLIAAVEETSPNVVAPGEDVHKAIHLDSDSDLDFDKRLYDFGLGKRAYSYVSEYKRLPVYNFGLGKRSPRYDFGLGKRSEPDDVDQNLEEYDEYPYGDDEEAKTPEIELYDDEDMQGLDKRQKLYSFGLGKRVPRYEFGLGKRASRYDFGLGKKSQRFNFGLGKRERLYNFGLGKRDNSRLYSFGLGKRPSDRGLSQSRFNFGLGKRSVEDGGIYKREVSDHEENNSAESDFAHASVAGGEGVNDTVEVDSHEVMGHPGHSQQAHHGQPAKRSVQPYDFGLGKRLAFHYPLDSKFSRQFRKPMYDFGLGKRRYDFGLGKRSYDQ